MKLHGDFDIFVPDGRALDEVLPGITHVAIGAHPDDIEFMALHGILACYGKQSFAGITCTDGRGSPLNELARTPEEMVATRRREQRTAAQIGRYGLMVQLDFQSEVIRNPTNQSLQNDLQQLLTAIHPRVVYTHNPADKHATHVAVTYAVVEAIRKCSQSKRPGAVYGCEVWRDLDWLPDNRKVRLDVSENPEVGERLNAVFLSQIISKRYDRAVMGRRLANAIFAQSHDNDGTTSVTHAMDLTPLILDESPDLSSYVQGLILEFSAEVLATLTKFRTGRALRLD